MNKVIFMRMCFQGNRVALLWLSGNHWSILRPLPPKRWATEKEVFWVTCQVPRELPFGDIATGQWLMTRPVEAQVCMYLTDRLFLCTHITWKRLTDFGHSNTVVTLLGWTRSKYCKKKARGLWWGGGDPPKYFVSIQYSRALIYFEIRVYVSSLPSYT